MLIHPEISGSRSKNARKILNAVSVSGQTCTGMLNYEDNIASAKCPNVAATLKQLFGKNRFSS